MKLQNNGRQKVKREIPKTLFGFVSFVFAEILRQKKWLLLPIWILLAIIAVLIVLGGGSTILPAIYIAF
jgi:hypothetical protein